MTMETEVYVILTGFHVDFDFAIGIIALAIV